MNILKKSSMLFAVCAMALQISAQTAKPVSSLKELANGKEYIFDTGFWDEEESDYFSLEKDYSQEPFTTFSLNKDANELNVREMLEKEGNDGQIQYEVKSKSVYSVEIKGETIYNIKSLSEYDIVKFDSLLFLPNQSKYYNCLQNNRKNNKTMLYLNLDTIDTSKIK